MNPGDLFLLTSPHRMPPGARYTSGTILQVLEPEVMLVLWADGYRCNAFTWDLKAKYERIPYEVR